MTYDRPHPAIGAPGHSEPGALEEASHRLLGVAHAKDVFAVAANYRDCHGVV